MLIPVGDEALDLTAQVGDRGEGAAATMLCRATTFLGSAAESIASILASRNRERERAPVGHKAAVRMRGSIALGARWSTVDPTLPYPTLPCTAMGLFI
jgi:hypothetical protein